jgi:hypothetical protein
MTACNTDGSFCCGKMDPQFCCASPTKIFLPTNVTQTSVSPNRNDSTVSSSTINSTSVAPMSHLSKPLKKQAKIGIIVGVSIFVVATVMLLVIMVRAKRRRKKQRDVAGSALSAAIEMKNIEIKRKATEIKGTEIYEKDGSELHEFDQNLSSPRELRGDPHSAVELPDEPSFPP